MLRPFASTTKEDIRNEVRAITKICKTGTHQNIVSIIRHGSLSTSDYYFIDMELCDINLADYIVGKQSAIADGSIAPSVTNVALGIENRLSIINFQESSRIMIDITSGLEFLHQNNIVHRDLKPSNGTK